MKPTKKYLRNKIVYNFFTDIRSVINRFVFFNINFLNDDYIKTHAKIK